MGMDAKLPMRDDPAGSRWRDDGPFRVLTAIQDALVAAGAGECRPLRWKNGANWSPIMEMPQTTKFPSTMDNRGSLTVSLTPSMNRAAYACAEPNGNGVRDSANHHCIGGLPPQTATLPMTVSNSGQYNDRVDTAEWSGDDELRRCIMQLRFPCGCWRRAANYATVLLKHRSLLRTKIS